MYAESPRDHTFQEDLERFCQEETLCSHFQNKSFLITGATGLIGSQLIKTLACANRLKNLQLQVFAQTRSQEKIDSVFENVANRPEITWLIGAPQPKSNWPKHVDYIIHTASITTSRTFITNPVETLRTAIESTISILDYSRYTSIDSMLYLSSMEVYGQTPISWNPITEEKVGYLDPVALRSSYSEGKRSCECLCTAYASEYDVPVKIARLAQTFGAGCNINDSRVFAQFTRNALRNEDLVLHTEGKSIGNYCYTTDAVRGIFTILTRGSNGEAYTVVNETTSRPIREVAALVSQILSNGISQVVFDIPESKNTYGYPPDAAMYLSAEKLRNLGWEPWVDLPEMFQRLAASFTQQQQ